MFSRFRIRLTVLALLVAAVAAASCRRAPLRSAASDAGPDGGGGGPSVSDGGRVHLTLDAPADATAEAAIEAMPDATTPDATMPDATMPDAPRDGGADTAAPATCSTALPPLDVCGCGCCGGVQESSACYYPSLGQSREAIPNPMPTPEECATTGCSFGLRYVCCADPGPGAASGTVCGIDTSLEDLPRFTITRRDGDVCTTLELGGVAGGFLRVAGPPGRASANAWRGACDGSTRTYAIGGLGQVTPGTSGTLLPFPRYDVHVVLFFDAGTGVAEAVRIDQDEVGIAARCTSDVCPPCGG